MGNSATKLPYNPSSRKVTGFAHYAGIWQIYVGDDGATLIFRHDKKGARAVDTACAQNALKRMRSLRHPYILKLLVRPQGLWWAAKWALQPQSYAPSSPPHTCSH